VRTSDIKLQLNNAAFWSAETKQPTVGSFVLFQFYFTMCDGLNTGKNNKSTDNNSLSWKWCAWANT